MPVMEVAALVSGAVRAYNLVAAAVNKGREIQDTAAYLGQFFDAKEKILEAEQENKYGPKLLRGRSVEAQALEIQMAKHKMEQMENQLRELCLYTVGADFYNEMMATRRKIRQRRLEEAKNRALRKKMIIDGMLVVSLFMLLIGTIIVSVKLLAQR
jgi:hypothetical protein